MAKYLDLMAASLLGSVPAGKSFTAKRLPVAESSSIRSNRASWAGPGEIGEQAFRRPGCGFVRVETSLLECGRPVVSQIGRHSASIGLRLGVVRREHFGFELQHLWLIHFEYRRS